MKADIEIEAGKKPGNFLNIDKVNIGPCNVDKIELIGVVQTNEARKIPICTRHHNTRL